jgi:hypothetical protein
MRILAKAAWLAAAAAVCVQPARSQTPLKGAIEGDVVDASTGRGISGARVRIQSGQDDPMFTSTDEQGHFQFAGLKFKSYQLDARYPGFISSTGAAGVSAREMVHLVRNGPNGQVRLEMRRSAAIEGKVTDAFGVPLEGAPVEALQRYASGERRGAAPFAEGGYQYVMVQETFTDDLGEYRIAPLGAGSYYVLVRPGSNYFSGQPAMRPPSDERERATFYPHALKPSETKPVELAEGKELRVDVQIIRQAGVKVSGRLLGLPPEDAASRFVSVFVTTLSPGASRSSSTVDGDRFTAPDLLPGKYLFEAGQYATGDWTYQNPLAAARRTVEVGTEDVDGIDLTLAPIPDVEGTVVFESGCAATPVWIQLQGDSHLPRNLHVGADGRFVLRHLFPGKYKAYVRPESLPYAFATSARLGDAEVLADGFEATAETIGPLRITMSCSRR